jgi:NAD(P)-dependent dehydrogenase (short-subunit alcohol dehydrogenase family)
MSKAAQAIVVTGSTRGIGLGLAIELARRGHRVAVSGRTREAVDLAVGAVRAAAAPQARVIGVAGDVSRAADLQRLWDEAARELGRIDVWINNAGLSHPRQRIGELRAADIRTVAETNLLGMMLATQIALRGMSAQGGGTIFNMEGFGSNGMMTPGMSLYGASKFALTYFNKCLIRETRGGPVKICYLSPGIVVTDLLKRDMGSTSAADRERTRRIYNILADRVETVTPHLAEGVLRKHESGDRVAWLTGGKAAWRFMTAGFRKRNIVSEADLQPR